MSHEDFDDEFGELDPETEIADLAGDEPVSKPVVRARPEQTRDDTDAGWGERPNDSAYEQYLREQRPPHWE